MATVASAVWTFHATCMQEPLTQLLAREANGNPHPCLPGMRGGRAPDPKCPTVPWEPLKLAGVCSPSKAREGGLA